MRLLIVRRPRSRSIADRLAYARRVVTKLTDNPDFPHPIPAFADLVARLAVAEAAQVKALTREIGTAAALRAALREVESSLRSVEVHVQHAANLDGVNGRAILANAGMYEKDARGPSPEDFAVEQGPVSGSVRLRARAIARKASYEWQYSTDEEHWTTAETTFECKTTLFGLTPATRHSFRFRARTRQGLGDWSRVISMIVT